jgi:hypothetical protein
VLVRCVIMGVVRCVIGTLANLKQQYDEKPKDIFGEHYDKLSQIKTGNASLATRSKTSYRSDSLPFSNVPHFSIHKFKKESLPISISLTLRRPRDAINQCDSQWGSSALVT